MFDIIKGVNIGQGEGNAFGGGIYAASCEVGFSNGPSRITLNVVSESGVYQSVNPNIYSTPYNVDLNGKVFSGMYLYAYEKQKSAGQNLMTVSFIDSSLVLDKIFIGLLNRHGNTNRVTSIETGMFTVRCPSCTQGVITGINGLIRRYLDAIPNGYYYQRNADGGGFIIIGKENFPESNCEIPKVDYNFSELCDAMTAFGIKHDLKIFDINNLYRQEYVGTLREVLNNWAGDFGFEFYYDGNTLKGIDLRKPINIDSIVSFSTRNKFVTQTSFSETLENTYVQSVVARYLKPSTAVEYNNTFHFKNISTQIGIADILKNGICAGCAGTTLLTRIALARVDKALREAYLANLAAANNDAAPLEALGFKNAPTQGFPYLVGEPTKIAVLNYLAQTRNQGNLTSDFTNPDNFAVFIGLYRSDIKQAVENWDDGAASFLGKYYTFVAPLPSNSYACPYSSDWFIYYTYNSQWSTMPTSETYGGDAVPFAHLLRDPTSDTYFGTIRTRNLFECQDNSWGIEQATYDLVKGTSDYDAFKPQIIPFDDCPVPVEMALATIQQKSMSSNPLSFYIPSIFTDSFAQGAIVAFCVVPLLSAIPTAPAISPIAGRKVNPLVYQRVTSRVNNDESAAKCITYCDSSIVSEICNCGATYTPIPYFAHLYAPYFQVRHSNGKTSNIIFPVDANYYGYFTHTRYYKTTNAPVKKIYGTPPTKASNTLATRIIDYDITPDIDAVMDMNDAVNLYIYSPTNKRIMTAQDYYTQISNLTNMTVLPQKKCSMTIAKSNLGSLGIPISPANGLVSMNISLADGGVETQLEYATRPPVIPKEEAVFTKVKFRLRTK